MSASAPAQARSCTRSLRIAFLTPYFLSPDQPGALRSWQTARLLAERGHRVTVLTADTHYMTGQDQAATSPEPFASRIRVRYLRTPRDYRTARFGRLRYMLQLAALSALALLHGPRQDVVLAVTPPPLLGLAALLAARVRGSRFVYEVRDLLIDDALAIGYLKSPLLARIGYALESTLYRASQAIVAVTPGIAEVIVRRGVPASKVVTVTNGYDEELFECPPADCDPRVEHGWGERFVAIYIGAMGKTRDLRTILDAASLLRDDRRFLFVFVGDGEQRSVMEQLAARRGLQNCSFVGTLPHRYVPVYCAAADVGINLFSRNELWQHVLGNKTFDYLGSGTAMIFGGAGDTARLLEDARAGIAIEPENPAALAEALRRLATDRAALRRMGENGRRYVAERYSRRRVTMALVELIERVAARTPEAARRGTARAS